MIKMNRGKRPQVLKENKDEWTSKYIETEKWRTNWHGKREEILKELLENTNYHCAFCDEILSPIGSGDAEIEHFRPKNKGKYPLFAFAWANLYPICRHCNSTKGERFDKLLLRPDEKGFDFFDWFILDTTTFELKPKKLGNPDWKRAEKTIDLYGLNKKTKKERRKIVYQRIIQKFYPNKEEQPFRYM